MVDLKIFPVLTSKEKLLFSKLDKLFKTGTNAPFIPVPNSISTLLALSNCNIPFILQSLLRVFKRLI